MNNKEQEIMKHVYTRPQMDFAELEMLNDILEGIGVKSTGTSAGGITGGDAKQRPSWEQNGNATTWGDLWK